MPIVDWETLRQTYRRLALDRIAQEIPGDDPAFACNVAFVENRLEEGRELATHFAGEYAGRSLVVLDVGAGIGGVAVGLGNEPANFMIALDVVFNPVLHQLPLVTGVPVRHVIASADALPFRSGAIDVVLCLETLEHLPRARESAREMMRVTRGGGQIMITTPARARYLLRPDPHLAIRGLLLLPDGLQKVVVERWLRRRGGYDVEHTFWLAPSILRLFPDRARSETLVNVPWPPPPRTPAMWWGLARHHFWKRLRHILWDRIVIYKRGSQTIRNGAEMPTRNPRA